MMMDLARGESHRAANVVNLKPDAGEAFRRGTFRQNADRALRHHLRHELVRVEHRARHCGEQRSLARTTRVVTHVCDDDAGVSGDPGSCFSRYPLDRYWFLIHEIYFTPPAGIF